MKSLEIKIDKKVTQDCTFDDIVQIIENQLDACLCGFIIETGLPPTEIILDEWVYSIAITFRVLDRGISCSFYRDIKCSFR